MTRQALLLPGMEFGAACELVAANLPRPENLEVGAPNLTATGGDPPKPWVALSNGPAGVVIGRSPHCPEAMSDALVGAGGLDKEQLREQALSGAPGALLPYVVVDGSYEPELADALAQALREPGARREEALTVAAQLPSDWALPLIAEVRDTLEPDEQAECERIFSMPIWFDV